MINRNIYAFCNIKTINMINNLNDIFLLCTYNFPVLIQKEIYAQIADIIQCFLQKNPTNQQ